MPILLGADLGTTTITALALDTATGDVLATVSAPNRAETTSTTDKARGWSEWDPLRIVATASDCLRGVAERLGGRRADVAGLGLTGQQHGVVVADGHNTPLTPFINWQDRRALIPDPNGTTALQRALARVGPDAPRRAGCRLAAGYMGVTLFWLKETGALPAGGTACFLTDFFAATLTGQPPATDPTCAASSGVFNVAAGDWDPTALAALGLMAELFPPVRPSGDFLGGLTRDAADATGLRAGLPVFVGIGDHQASFVGSVGDPTGAVLVNVGTGGQVAALADRPTDDPLLEARPFPRGGVLLVAAGLCGGSSYAALERFFRQVGESLFGVRADEPLYPLMNRLAAEVPAGAAGLTCDPLFAGTRARPELRGTLAGVSLENFTPAYLTRALLEGMARTFRDGADRIARASGRSATRPIGAGNGLRENPVLADIVTDAFGMPVEFARHAEEAACGAALIAAVGAGVFTDVAAAGQLVYASAKRH